ncbi:hypothetical protein NP493_53g00000 [Ridgeia piscesae]|uniref:G-protein coupled receptors family 1 profile domain-containing protein n=1 Tax=Ridgeia piscesae TaxID=27915 RepID=A0AAD9PAP7_RIDPI|nr:hypothetical protein NP493_53g00000 [Ridgeia piscesae]
MLSTYNDTSGGGSGSGSNSNGGALMMNVTEIFALLKKLTPLQREELSRSLQQSIEPDEILDLLQGGSYDDDLSQYTQYQLHKALLLYVPPILILLGTFGNIFSFIILKRKAMLKFSTYFYLMILALADTLVLYVGLLRLWIGELTRHDILVTADWLCKLTNVIGYTVSDFSVWLIIAVTIERYIVVCHPLKANSLCNSQRAKKVIVALLGAMFALNAHFFWTVEVRQFKHSQVPVRVCAAVERHAYVMENVWPWVDAVVYSFLPFAFIITLNGLIIRQVLLSRHHRHELRSAGIGELGGGGSGGSGGSVTEQRRPSHEGNTRLTVMLLTISFAFLLTTLPMNVANIAATFCNVFKNDLQRVAKFRLARTITELLMYVNHSMNFFLYCATGQKFRHQLVWMVCYAKRPYRLSWGSEHSQATRMDSLRNGKSRKSTNETDLFVPVKTDMYLPLKCNV